MCFERRLHVTASPGRARGCPRLDARRGTTSPSLQNTLALTQANSADEAAHERMSTKMNDRRNKQFEQFNVKQQARLNERRVSSYDARGGRARSGFRYNHES